jgi:hypothetical protein
MSKAFVRRQRMMLRWRMSDRLEIESDFVLILQDGTADKFRRSHTFQRVKERRS